MDLPEKSFINSYRFYGICLLTILVGIQCNSKSNTQDENSLLPFLGKEDPNQGICTVRGIGSSIQAGYVQASTEEKPLSFKATGNTSYAVVGVSNANSGTELLFNVNLKGDVYKASDCPLELDRVPVAESTKDYFTTYQPNTKIVFLKKGNYMVYIHLSKDSYPESTPTVVLQGTPTGSGSNVPGVGNLSFVKSCNNTNANTCTELFGSETDCESGEVEIPNQGRCDTNNVLGVCRKPIGTSGYRFRIIYNQGGVNHQQATLLCQAYGGFYSQGYSQP